MMWLAVLIIIAAAVILLLVSRLQVQVYYARETGNDKLRVRIFGLYGLVRYCYVIPHIRYAGLMKKIIERTAKSKEEPVPSARKENGFAGALHRQLDMVRKRLPEVLRRSEWLKQTLARVHCTDFYWESSIGAGNAPDTAVLTGMAWSIKSSLLGYLFGYIHLHAQPKLAVRPMFFDNAFSTQLTCTMSLRVGHALLASIQLAFRLLAASRGQRTANRRVLTGAG